MIISRTILTGDGERLLGRLEEVLVSHQRILEEITRLRMEVEAAVNARIFASGPRYKRIPIKTPK